MDVNVLPSINKGSFLSFSFPFLSFSPKVFLRVHTGEGEEMFHGTNTLAMIVARVSILSAFSEI